MMMLIFWSSCKKAEENVTEQPNNELLTTVEVVAINTANPLDSSYARWASVPGVGLDTSNARLYLKPNATYNVRVNFLDESQSPSVDITPSIKLRGNYHLICFSPSGGLNLTVTPTDRDSNTPALPLGLSNLFTTTAASNGSLQVTLHHQPNVKNGDCAPGSIDADVNFTVYID